MSRNFNASPYGEASSVGSLTRPFTFACWFNPNVNIGSAMSFMTYTDHSNLSNYGLITQYSGTGSFWSLDLRDADTVGGQVDVIAGTVQLTANSWFHGCGIFTSTTSRTVFINGGNKTTASGTVAQAANTFINIGTLNDSGSYGSFFNGQIADAAIWTVGLTDAEVLALSQGARPFQIRPAALKYYWPLFGLASPEVDLSGNAKNLVLTGSPAKGVSDPPLMMFTPRWPQSLMVASAPPSTTLFAQALL